MDGWTWAIDKGATKCDVHFDLQGFVSQWELERMLYPMGFPQGVLCLSAIVHDSCGASGLHTLAIHVVSMCASGFSPWHIFPVGPAEHTCVQELKHHQAGPPVHYRPLPDTLLPFGYEARASYLLNLSI